MVMLTVGVALDAAGDAWITNVVVPWNVIFNAPLCEAIV